MRDVVIPYNTMSYDTVKPPSNGWVGATHRRKARGLGGLRRAELSFTHPTKDLSNTTPLNVLSAWSKSTYGIGGIVG